MAQFQPGQSGNPGGRPKGTSALAEAARAKTEEALNVLIAAMADEDVRARITAAQAILDRGYGKPAQSVDLGSDPDRPVISEVRWLVVGKP